MTTWINKGTDSEKKLAIGDGFFLTVGDEFYLLIDGDDTSLWVSDLKN